MNQESQSCLKTFLILTCWVNGPLSNSTFILKGSTFIPLLSNFLFTLHPEKQVMVFIRQWRDFSCKLGFFLICYNFIKVKPVFSPSLTIACQPKFSNCSLRNYSHIDSVIPKYSEIYQHTRKARTEKLGETANFKILKKGINQEYL